MSNKLGASQLASKRKGMWMGGSVPLGYDNVDKKLVINETEAKLVRLIFVTYLKSNGVKQACHTLTEQGYRTKARKGVNTGNCKFSCGHIYYILKNRLYIGEIAHKGKHYQGNHAPIIDQDIWGKVQTKLKTSRSAIKNGIHFKNPSLLTGLLKTDKGEPLTPTHANKQGKRYRYYITKSDEFDHKAVRYPARQIERTVINELINKFDDQHVGVSNGRSKEFYILKAGSSSEKRGLLQRLIKSIALSSDQMEISLKNENAADDEIGGTVIILPISFKEGIKGKKIIIPSGRQIIQTPDKKLISLIAIAHLYMKDLQSGKYETMKELADEHGTNKSDLGKNIRLAMLAPDIITSILEGRQPATLKATHLRRLSDFPSDWEAQRELLGFN